MNTQTEIERPSWHVRPLLGYPSSLIMFALAYIIMQLALPISAAFAATVVVLGVATLIYTLVADIKYRRLQTKV